jgi:hypothetical protein
MTQIFADKAGKEPRSSEQIFDLRYHKTPNGTFFILHLCPSATSADNPSSEAAPRNELSADDADFRR